MLSTFLGGFVLYLLNVEINDFVLLLFISVATGMILYLSLFELLKEVFNYISFRLSEIIIPIIW